VAKGIGAKVEWDSEGHICRVTHDVTIRLSRKLNIVTLSVAEYMSLAQREPSVASSNFAEWLSDSFTLDASGSCFNGHNEPVEMPVGRPGWFRLDEVDGRGFPTNLKENSAGDWKYWSLNPEDSGVRSGAMRSFVTSSGTCSLDLGIPSFAQHSMIMIRECYQALKPEIISPMERIWNNYPRISAKRDDEAIREFLIAQDIGNLPLGLNSNTLLNDKEYERKFDIIGKKRLVEGTFGNLNILGVEKLRETLSGVPDCNTTYVRGYHHPDADSVLSSVFEAFRRNNVYTGKLHLPWTEAIPIEVQHILDLELIELLAKIPMFKNYHDVVLVDSHSFDGVSQSQVKVVVDHHPIDISFPSYVAISQESS